MPCRDENFVILWKCAVAGQKLPADTHTHTMCFMLSPVDLNQTCQASSGLQRHLKPMPCMCCKTLLSEVLMLLIQSHAYFSDFLRQFCRKHSGHFAKHITCLLALQNESYDLFSPLSEEAVGTNASSMFWICLDESWYSLSCNRIGRLITDLVIHTASASSFMFTLVAPILCWCLLQHCNFVITLSGVFSFAGQNYLCPIQNLLLFQ